MNGRADWRHSSRVFHVKALEYDSWFEESLLFDIEMAAIKALPAVEPGPSLEIGVGPGRFADALGSGFGIDPAMAPLALARRRNIAVCQAVGEALPFRSGCLARVSLFFTLCFVQDPERVISECHRVLQANGRLVIGFVPATGPWGKYLQQKKKNGHPFYEYASFLTAEEINTALSNQGFSVKSAVSSLYQEPGMVEQCETPRNGMDEAGGFVALLAEKYNLPYTEK